VVLDNCEYLRGACAALAASILGSCPGVAVLATSRESLDVPGEVTWRVPSLAWPPVSVVLTYQLATYWLPVQPGWVSLRILQKPDYI
jgi:predicted ATPase